MKTLNDNIQIYWLCNECQVMWIDGAMPDVCVCGNDLLVSSTKRKILLTFEIKEFIEDVKAEITSYKNCTFINWEGLKNSVDRLAGDGLNAQKTTNAKGEGK